MKTIAQNWDEYRKTLPENVGSIQLRETKRAFYAGGLALFAETMRAAKEKNHDAIDTIRSELEVFSVLAISGLL